VVVQFLDQSVYLSTLLDDPRVHDIASSILGDDFNYMGSDGNFYVGDTKWHSDGYGGRGGPKHIKIAFYLDPLTRHTGALRVIPGSHRVGEPYADQLERDVKNSETVWGISGDQIPAQALETVAGDVLVFNHDIKHSAWGGSTRRRMFTMNCCERYPEDKLPELREYIGHASRFFLERAYDDTIVRTATPERMVHLEQALANDFGLAELSRKRRLEMPEPARG
jgi:ectoine hydroxylase-related dioxygenase (phytanoyl-CoA dioxygenase family)